MALPIFLGRMPVDLDGGWLDPLMHRGWCVMGSLYLSGWAAHAMISTCICSRAASELVRQLSEFSLLRGKPTDPFHLTDEGIKLWAVTRRCGRDSPFNALVRDRAAANECIARLHGRSVRPQGRQCHLRVTLKSGEGSSVLAVFITDHHDSWWGGSLLPVAARVKILRTSSFHSRGRLMTRSRKIHLS